MYRRLQDFVVAAAVVAPLLGPGHGAPRPNVKPAPHSLEPPDVTKPMPEPVDFIAFHPFWHGGSPPPRSNFGSGRAVVNASERSTATVGPAMDALTGNAGGYYL